MEVIPTNTTNAEWTVRKSEKKNREKPDMSGYADHNIVMKNRTQENRIMKLGCFKMSDIVYINIFNKQSFYFAISQKLVFPNKLLVFTGNF